MKLSYVEVEPRVTPIASTISTSPAPFPGQVSARAADFGSSSPVKDDTNKVAPIGFLGRFSRMLGIQSTKESLSYPPRFSNRFHGDKELFSEGSFNINSNVVKSNKTIKMGELVGYNIDSFFVKIKSIIQGEQLKEI